LTEKEIEVPQDAWLIDNNWLSVIVSCSRSCRLRSRRHGDGSKKEARSSQSDNTTDQLDEKDDDDEQSEK
jgi:hypothetical protein